MDKNPLVSVVVPVYNVEKYLDRCVNSLVSQTLNEIEIILVDDESHDNSAEMCDVWARKDSRIRVIHKENEGLGLSRNAGLSMASGEYVAFVDSDDYVDPEMYEMLYYECKKYDLDCIYSEFNVDDYPGIRVIKRTAKLYIGKQEIEQLRLDIVGAEPSYISGVKYHCSSCKGLYKRDDIKLYKIAFRSEREYIAEDMVFNLDFLYYANRVKIVPWQFYHYCLNNSSLTHTYRSDRWSKSLKMLQVLNTVDRYEDKSQLSLRLKRTAIFYTMSAIAQEWKRDIPFLEKLDEIKKIECEPVIRDVTKDYPINQLPIKWKIYTFLLKLKLLHYFYVFIGR